MNQQQQQHQPGAVGQGFRFQAGEVGSAVMTKKKARRGALGALQMELAQQRASFLQWHQRELKRAQACFSISLPCKALSPYLCLELLL